VKFTIAIPEKISLNKIYAGVHFRERMRHKEDYWYAVQEAKIAPYSGEYPIHVKYHFKLTGTPLDIDNHVYMAKMVADALVAAEIIPGDEQKYICAITVTAEKVKKGGVDVVDVELVCNEREVDTAMG
jgi:Holliday junction resolvase RusA-like endonuclease